MKRILVIICTILTVLSCKSGEEGISSLSLSAKRVTMDIGSKISLSVAAKPAGAEIGTVIWASSAPDIAVTDSIGVITALKVGETTISAQTNGKTAYCIISVEKVDVTSISLDSTSLALNAGGHHRLKVTILPDNASIRRIEWKSSDISVATVDSAGTVNGVGVGAAVITAEADGKMVSCQVSVKADSLGKIGQYTTDYGGGIVFWQSADGKTVKLLSMTEKFGLNWSDAKVWCSNYGDGKWYLPAIEELTLIHNVFNVVNTALSANKGTMLTVQNFCYWSSTEYSSVYAYREKLMTGEIYYQGYDEEKTSTWNYTRAVRTVEFK